MQSKVVQGYKVLPLRFSEGSKDYHELFVKEHLTQNQSKDNSLEPALYVLNVPPYATEDSLKTAFSCIGCVTSVKFQDNSSCKDKTSSGFKTAYVFFNDKASVQKALNSAELGTLSTDDNPILMGVEKWIKEYNSSVYDCAQLEESVNKFMANYDKEEKKRKQQEKNKDDGGWKLVTKKGRNPGLSRKESVGSKLLEKADKGMKRKQLDDFYRFQKRESKMRRIVEMRKKYEQDKKKVEIMKQARKFKPF